MIYEIEKAVARRRADEETEMRYKTWLRSLSTADLLLVDRAAGLNGDSNEAQTMICDEIKWRKCDV